MSSLSVEVLNQTHPSYCEEELEQQRALYKGGADWHRHVRHWLPRHPQEAFPMWRHRQERATYENNAGPIVDLLAGGVFMRPPQVENIEGDWVQPFMADVDRCGNSMNAWLEDRLIDAMQGQRAYGWVNLPEVNGQPANRLQQETSGQLDAFLVDMQACDVIDWGHDSYGALQWLMHRRRESVRPSISSERVCRITWTYIDGEVIRQWQWTADSPRDHEPVKGTVVSAILDIAHGFGEIPVAEIRLDDSMFIMGKLKDPAIALTRSQNDLDWSLYRAAHALLWIRSKWEPDTPLLAPGAFYKLGRDREGADEMGYAEPSGVSFEHQAQRVTQQRHGMYRVVHQMAQSYDPNSGSRAQLSGESKAQDWRAAEIVMSAYADALRPFVTRVLRLVSRVKDGAKKMQTPRVGGLEGWHQEDLLPFLTATSLATEALMLSETFHRAVAKEQVRRVLPYMSEDTAQKIEAEIDKAPIDLSLFQPPPPGDPNDPAGPGGADTKPRDQDGDGVVDEQ